jgi:hypothetical protein
MLAFAATVFYTSAKVTDAVLTDSIDADGVPGAVVASFPANAEVLYASAILQNAPDNTQVRVVWTYMNENQMIDQVVIDSGYISDRYIYSSWSRRRFCRKAITWWYSSLRTGRSRMRPLYSW